MAPKDDVLASPGFHTGGDDTVIEAAWLYYQDGLNQSEIAARLGVSRASVVNYLRAAREAGHVKTILTEDAFACHELAQALVRAFGLRGAYVVPGGADHAETESRCVRAAGHLLPRLLKPGDRLGVAWGKTLHDMAGHIEPVRIAGLTVLQLLGSMSTPYGFSSDAVSSNIARAFDAVCQNLHAPAIASSSEVAQMITREPIIARQLAQATEFNRAVFAAGRCGENSHAVTAGIASKADMADYIARGARAVICGRFIDARGRELEGPLDGRMIGIPLSALKAAETRFLVSSRPCRTEAMRAALTGGYATHVITHKAEAKALLTAPG